jgi:O-methyltransferase involved in polyketide biosynthesis
MATKAMDAHAYTALPIAAARAIASQGNNPMIRDPLAAKLVAGETHLLRAGANSEYMSMRWGLTLAHFRAQLEDLREHIARVRAQLEHPRDPPTGYFG